jgi:hypothetical protein
MSEARVVRSESGLADIYLLVFAELGAVWGETYSSTAM